MEKKVMAVSNTARDRIRVARARRWRVLRSRRNLIQKEKREGEGGRERGKGEGKGGRGKEEGKKMCTRV